MKTTRKSRRSHAIALALAAGLLAGAFTFATPLHAQASSPSDLASQKMQLQLEALDAKATGDFAKAKDLLTQIITLDPKDPNNSEIQAQIAVLDNAIASQGASKPAASTAVAADTAAPAASTDTAAPAAAAPAAPAPTPESEVALKAEAARQAALLASIGGSIDKATSLNDSGDYAGARDLLGSTKTQVPVGMAYTDLRTRITDEISRSWYLQAVSDYNAKKLAAAKDDLAKFVDANGGPDSRSTDLNAQIASAQANPLQQDINQISPGFEKEQEVINQLLVTGRAQYLYGDFDGASETFNQVIIHSPNNIEAKAYMLRISDILIQRGDINRRETRAGMLKEVEDDWSRPVYNQAESAGPTPPPVVSAEMKKLSAIFIPSVDIQVPTPLETVVEVLHDLSVQFDPDQKGVNMQVFVPDGEQMPKITLPGITNLDLAEILSIACKKAGYSYGPDGHIIALRKGGASGAAANLGFTRATLGLSDGAMDALGISTGGGAAGAASPTANPFGDTSAAAPAPAPAAAPADNSGGDSGGDIAALLKKKFTDNGIDFPDGSTITMLGKANNKMEVFNTPENIANLRSFLNTLSDVKQVQIEARFLDVSQGALQSFGARWNIANSRLPQDYLQTTSNITSAQTNNLRDLSTTFSQGSSNAAPTVITGLTGQTINGTLGGSGLTFLPGSIIDNQVIPTLPTAVNTGLNSSDMFSGVVSWLDGYRIQLVLDMLSQEEGSDLMTSPKLTVEDGNPARMLVAQEFLYPRQFQAVTATVSPASGGGLGGSAGGGIAIAAGNPNDFVTQDVGVTMTVTPNVQPDDSIRISVNPTVTEFDGFVEYGSASIAIQGTITAVVPSGVIQPIFDVRTMDTVLTVSDGATIVMGGMTRDEVKTVDDKVPGLGDIPIIGRLFQSKGETSEKRNLMIFITANLIGPGGSPALQNFNTLTPGTVFTNPTLVLPSGAFERPPAKSLTPTTPAPQQ